MIDAVALIGYAVAMATVGAAALRRARWLCAAPALGIAAWQMLTFTVLSSLLLAALVVSMPGAISGGSLAELLHACLVELRAQYATPGGAVTHAAGAAALALILARSAVFLARGLRDARRVRHDHLSGLRLVARRDPRFEALVVDHPAAAAYCLPGRSHTIVLTSTAVASLTDSELVAVLTHERAHLRGRHHLVLALAAAFARALPFLPGLRWAYQEQARLLEMLADDAAVRRTCPQAVARAVVRLADARVPATALGAAGIATAARVHRLVSPRKPVAVASKGAMFLALLALAVAPATLAAVPAVAAAQSRYCPVPGPGQAISSVSAPQIGGRPTVSLVFTH